MTDNEIIKALECCEKDDCDNCPNDFGNCYANLAGYALDLINRQKAEIEALIAGQETLQKYIAEQKAEIESLAKKYEMAVAEREANVKGFTADIERLEKDRKENFEMWKKLCEQSEEKHEKMFQEAKATIRPKAIKEFAEKLKENCKVIGAPLITNRIDNLVKEMVGEGG